MRDNEVIIFILSFLNTQFAARSLSDVIIQQSYQPRDQGIPLGRTVFIHKISAPRYGYPGNKSVYNEQTGLFDNRKTQWVTPTYQFDALSIQNPSDVNSVTASDLLEETANILQSSVAIKSFKEQGIDIFRIDAIRENYIIDDQGRHEQLPSFDFKIGYQAVFSTNDFRVVDAEPNIFHV